MSESAKDADREHRAWASCNECDWSSIEGQEEYASVQADAETHSTFEHHKVSYHSRASDEEPPEEVR